MGKISRGIALLGSGILALDIISAGSCKEWERRLELRAERLHEMMNEKLAAERAERRAYEAGALEAMKAAEETQPGDNSRIDSLVDAAKRNDRRLISSSLSALGRIGTNQSKRAMYSLIVDSDRQEIRNMLPVYAAKELAAIDPDSAMEAIVESRRKLTGYSDEHPLIRGLNSVLYEIGDENSLKFLIETGRPDDVADFILKNRGGSFFYRNRDSIIPMLERRIVRAYYGGVEGINCNVDHNTMYKFSFAINIVDRTYAEKYLLTLAEDTKCTPFPVVDSLRNNSFR